MLKYDPLGQFLKTQSQDHIRLSLEQISELVGGLPRNAATAQFWANSRYHYPRRRSWLDAGFKAYFEAPDYVRFDRFVDESKAWSLNELRACVQAYKQLVDAKKAGSSISKAEVRRLTTPYLNRRTDSAYEYRMQNISAVMENLGLPVISGYPPARNVGGVAEAIVELIVDVFDRQSLDEIPTENEEHLVYRARATEAKYARDPSKQPPEGSREPQRTSKTVVYIKRNPEVVGWVRAQADGRCEACWLDAPFEDEMGTPFLEVHHVRPLAEGGPDTPDNAVAICPNCHRALHRAHNADVRRRELIRRVARLKDYPATLPL